MLVHILANLSSEPVPLPLIESEMHASVNAGVIDILGHVIDSRQTEQGKWRCAYRPVHTLDRRGDLFVQARHCCGLDRADQSFTDLVMRKSIGVLVWGNDALRRGDGQKQGDVVSGPAAASSTATSTTSP